MTEAGTFPSTVDPLSGSLGNLHLTASRRLAGFPSHPHAERRLDFINDNNNNNEFLNANGKSFRYESFQSKTYNAASCVAAFAVIFCQSFRSQVKR